MIGEKGIVEMDQWQQEKRANGVKDPKWTKRLKGLGIKTDLELSACSSSHWRCVCTVLSLCFAVGVRELPSVPILSCCLIKWLFFAVRSEWCCLSRPTLHSSYVS